MAVMRFLINSGKAFWWGLFSKGVNEETGIYEAKGLIRMIEVYIWGCRMARCVL